MHWRFRLTIFCYLEGGPSYWERTLRLGVLGRWCDIPLVQCTFPDISSRLCVDCRSLLVVYTLPRLAVYQGSESEVRGGSTRGLWHTVSVRQRWYETILRTGSLRYSYYVTKYGDSSSHWVSLRCHSSYFGVEFTQVSPGVVDVVTDRVSIHH